MNAPLSNPDSISLPPLKFYNSLTRQLETFETLAPGKVKLYVCGPTVYDDAHLGHARCYVTWDVLYRWLRFVGYEVTYVRNVTDIDDKILNRAQKYQLTPQQVAEKNYTAFREDMKVLNVLEPTEEPFATHYVQKMIEGAGELIRKGAAYSTAQGSVYYRTRYKKDYGKLSQKPLDDLQAGARVEVDPLKESPLDFALWKGVPADDPHFYDSPWGHGRPGWHMECSTMIHAILGEQIDIHAGGADLIFPHHENEIAQSEAWTGKVPFVRYWMHNGFVNVSGEKMSKSLGNFSTVKKVLEHYSGNTIRYFLLTHHYRMPVEFSDEALEGARNWTVNKFNNLREICQYLKLSPEEIQRLSRKGFPENRRGLTGQEDHPEDGSALLDFYSAVSNDLNTPQALAILNKAISRLNRDIHSGYYESNFTPGNENSPLAGKISSRRPFGRMDGIHQWCRGGYYSDREAENGAGDRGRLLLQDVFTMMEVLGFDLSELSEQRQLSEMKFRDSVTDEVLTVLDVQEQLDLRKKAKEAKDWAQADLIRNRLTRLGIQIKDNKDGTTSWEIIR